MGKKEKKRYGDRWDGRRIRDIDGMHIIMPMMYPGRCDNEAFIMETIDLTVLNAYLEKKNADRPDYKYNLFQCIVTAVLKTLTLRPKMNRFIANQTMYERKFLSASFVVKREFSDKSSEGLAILYAQPDSNIDSVHDEIYKQVMPLKKESSGAVDPSMKALDAFGRIPLGLLKLILKFMRFLDARGKVPRSLIATDPYYSSVVLTNLGSIKLRSGYHHLTNWGTNSVFVAIGEKKMRPFYKEDGSYEMHDSVTLGLTIDERLADGYYYSKTVRLLKKLLENPDLLERPMREEVEY